MSRCGTNALSVMRCHGLPQAAQQPRSDVPALMHRSANSGGNVAKCAALKGDVAIVQDITQRTRASFAG